MREIDIESLAEMCLKVVEMLEKLYQNGRISQEIYLEHTELKKYFLNNLPTGSCDGRYE